MVPKVCSIPECGSAHLARGLCNKHWLRMRASGDLKVNLTGPERFWTKVDKTGSCWLYAGPFIKGYGTFGDDGSRSYAHRFSYELQNGPIPEGLVIDHRCHNKACVNPEHLRAVTVKQNMENRAGAQRNSGSGIRGVYWHKARSKWTASVHHNGTQVYVGIFEAKADAEAAVIAKRNELFTHNDRDRIPV